MSQVKNGFFNLEIRSKTVFKVYLRYAKHRSKTAGFEAWNGSSLPFQNQSKIVDVRTCWVGDK